MTALRRVRVAQRPGLPHRIRQAVHGVCRFPELAELELRQLRLGLAACRQRRRHNDQHKKPTTHVASQRPQSFRWLPGPPEQMAPRSELAEPSEVSRADNRLSGPNPADTPRQRCTRGQLQANRPRSGVGTTAISSTVRSWRRHHSGGFLVDACGDCRRRAPRFRQHHSLRCSAEIP